MDSDLQGSRRRIFNLIELFLFQFLLFYLVFFLLLKSLQKFIVASLTFRETTLSVLDLVPPTTSVLQIISRLALVKLSGQIYFCSDISHSSLDKHR